MLDLSFEIISAEVVPYSVLPTLNFKMRIANVSTEERIQNVNLKCQIMLPVTKRHYTARRKGQTPGSFRYAGTLGRDLARVSVDSRQYGSPTVLRQYRRRSSSPMLVRFRGSKHEVLRCPGGW